MKKILLFLVLGFALFAGPAAVMYPHQAVAKNILTIEPHLFLARNDRPL